MKSRAMMDEIYTNDFDEGMPLRVHVGEGYLVRATASRFFVERGLPTAAETFEGTVRLDILTQLLAGAIYAAALHVRRTRHAVATFAVSGNMSLMSYVWTLIGSYHTTHATPRLLTAVAERFANAGRKALAEYCRHSAHEEAGHDALALLDLTALGYSAKPLVNTIHPRHHVALVDLFSRYAESEYPVACLGYAYALERIALLLDAEKIAAIESLIIPKGVHATRCLRVHSGVGADARHVRCSLEFMATLPATDTARIARAVFETVALICDPALSDFPGDEAAAARVSAWRLRETSDPDLRTLG